MSHSVHPYSFRLNILRNWKSRWFEVARQYKERFKTDTIIREWLFKKLEKMFIKDIEIERLHSSLRIILKTSRPGLLIGRRGEGLEKLKKEIEEKIRNLNTAEGDIKISVEEVREPEIHASIVSKMIKEDLEKRQPFRRVLKRTIEKSMANKKVQGIKIALSGRLDGSEMGRKEWLKKGRMSLQTLRSDIEFSKERAHLPYGDIGIKVWIYKGEKFGDKSS